MIILEAAKFAANRHQDQRRKGKSKRPYIGHLLDVAVTLATVGKVQDENIIVAALLHDTVEDTETSREEIRERFGQLAADLVSEVTDDKSLKKDERKRLQVEHAPHLSPGAKLIKVADKISNVAEIAHDPPKKWSVSRRRKYFDWAEEVVNAMGAPVDPELRLVFDKTLSDARALLDDSEE